MVDCAEDLTAVNGASAALKPKSHSAQRTISTADLVMFKAIGVTERQNLNSANIFRANAVS